MSAVAKKLISLFQMCMLYGLLLWFGPEALRTMPNLYVLVGVGAIAILYQPGFSALESGPSKDRGTAAQILWTIQGTQLLAHLEAVFLRFPASFEWTALAWGGLVVMVGGLAIRTWSVIHLGAAFTWHIDPDAADEVITTGPFSLVRHPSYVGAFCLYVGAVGFLQAWWTLPIALIAIPIAFARRIRWEEEALLERFGDRYAEYSRRVGAVFPKP